MSVALHLRPAAFPALALDRQERRLLAPISDPPARRQLHLEPQALFLEPNHSRAPLDAFPPFMPPGPPAKRPQYPAAPPAAPLALSMPCAPAGKSKSMGTAGLSSDDKRIGAAIRLESLAVLPATRGDCLSARAVSPKRASKMPKGDRGPRLAPCAFVSCRHHLYLDVNPESGAIKVNFPHLETVDVEMVEARMGWLERRTKVKREGETWTARVKADAGLAGFVYEATGKAEDVARRRLADILRPIVTAQETTLDLSLMEDTCSLDVGDRGEKREARRRLMKLETVGAKMRVTMERARQLLEHAQDEALAKASDGQEIRRLEGEDPNDVDGE